MSSQGAPASFYYTTAGIVIPIVTGSISMLSSFTIVIFILRSGTNTPYHRIMFCLSVFDILTSLAVALTTAPMPRDVEYPFRFPSYGTMTTCEIQGIVYMSGNGMVLCMNGMLNIYYACALRFKMEDKTFSKCLEPTLFFISFFSCFTTTLIFLYQKNFFYPSANDPFCSGNALPRACIDDGNEAAASACRNRLNNFEIIYLFGMGIALITLLVTMGLIIENFYRRARNLKSHARESAISNEEDNRQEQNESQRAQNMTATVTKQASLYVGAFFLTWTFTFVCFLNHARGQKSQSFVLEALRITFQPLQGFFNMLIFFYHKVDIIRRSSDEDLCPIMALRVAIDDPKSVPEIIISGIDGVVDVQHGIKPVPGQGFIPVLHAELNRKAPALNASSAAAFEDPNTPDTESSNPEEPSSSIGSSVMENTRAVDLRMNTFGSIESQPNSDKESFDDDEGLSYGASRTHLSKLSGFSFLSFSTGKEKESFHSEG